ncbi:Cell division protein FtsI/penicillin-binding protein 2 [gamma proteobacterium HdN1]|nr:Cell division protein FtsI/penicillin-binding protein 2 [gamma proteobacterium HdN1]
MRDYRWRFYVAALLLCTLSTSVFFRIAYLQLWNRDFLQDEGAKRVVRTATIPAYRGMIQDRNGEPLAVSTPVTTIWANPKQLWDERDRWPELAKALGEKSSSLSKHLTAMKDKQFMYLKRHMNPVKAAAVLNMDISGVYGLSEYRRFYPAGEVTSHIVGFNNIDDQGQEGIELAFEDTLRGEPGKKRVIKDLKGRIVKDIGLIENAKPGRDVMLSIDLRAQYIAYRELLAAVHAYQATAGVAVAVDVRTGEIVAMANQPSFNPNNRKPKDQDGFRNRAITDVFEPGSTMKVFTAAAGLESGRWKPSSLIDTTPGALRIGRKTIRDTHNYGLIDLTHMITKSSNVGATKVALSLKDGTLPTMLHRVGFGEKTGVGIQGEVSGVLPLRPSYGKERWGELETATMSYGYGVSVTAAQLARAYAILGAHGIKRPLSIVKTSGDVKGERVFSEGVAENVIKMMETVVSKEGTAQRAAVDGYRVGGKTGTVHKAAGGKYEARRYLGLFAGVAPAEDPRLALVIMIDDPKGKEYYGGQVAGPVFSRIMAGMLRIKNVPPDLPVQEWANIVPKGNGKS